MEEIYQNIWQILEEKKERAIEAKDAIIGSNWVEKEQEIYIQIQHKLL